jgi:hypothetical protein
MMQNYAALFAGIGIISLFQGCADSYPTLVEVGGKVTYQAKDVPLGTVTFTPVSSSKTGARPGTGIIGPDGTFQMRSFPDRLGMLPGEYEVGVHAFEGSFLEGNVVYIVPVRFANAHTSGLRTVVPDATDEPLRINFALAD